MEPREGETLDVLSNTLRLFQRRRGHRATSDDVRVRVVDWDTSDVVTVRH